MRNLGPSEHILNSTTKQFCRVSPDDVSALNGYRRLPLWSRVVLQKPPGSELVEKFPTYCGTHTLFTAFRKPAICPYPQPDQSTPCPHPSHFLRPIFVLPSHLLLVLSRGASAEIVSRNQKVHAICTPTESYRTAVCCAIYMYTMQLRSDVSRNISFGFL